MDEEILRVATLFDCSDIENEENANVYDHMWRQTLAGCKVLGLLQDMYGFNISYVFGENNNRDESERRLSVYPHPNDSIDLYARTMAFRANILDNAYPIQAIFTWRFGFILRRADSEMFPSLYTDPFERSVWYCLYLMVIAVTILFYFLHRWELHLLKSKGGGRECSIVYEALLVVTSLCQHSLPMQESTLLSRRTACFTFFLFSYVMYAFYTSNLLSNLVNDRDSGMDIDELANSKYDCAVLNNMRLAIEGQVVPYAQKLMEKKFSTINVVNTSAGLEAVNSGRLALLSDYVTLLPDIKKTFSNEAICQLIEIDLYKNIKKYLFTSKGFRHKELLKRGAIRAKETGLLMRLLDAPLKLHCEVPTEVAIQVEHIATPLTLLGFSYLTAVILLIAERASFNRYKPWPYIN